MSAVCQLWHFQSWQSGSPVLKELGWCLYHFESFGIRFRVISHYGSKPCGPVSQSLLLIMTNVRNLWQVCWHSISQHIMLLCKRALSVVLLTHWRWFDFAITHVSHRSSLSILQTSPEWVKLLKTSPEYRPYALTSSRGQNHCTRLCDWHCSDNCFYA